jgi:hypothetical protein
VPPASPDRPEPPLAEPGGEPLEELVGITDAATREEAVAGKSLPASVSMTSSGEVAKAGSIE